MPVTSLWRRSQRNLTRPSTISWHPERDSPHERNEKGFGVFTASGSGNDREVVGVQKEYSDVSVVKITPNEPVSCLFLVVALRHWGHADRFGATVKEITSPMRSTSSKRRKQASSSLICLSGSSGAASGRNLRSCSASVINRLKWPRWYATFVE